MSDSFLTEPAGESANTAAAGALPDLLRQMVERITASGKPERIILFGSRARGDAHHTSDYDLLIIQESQEPRYRRSARLYTLLSDLPVEIEIMVYTPQEVAKWIGVEGSLVSKALREGRVLYDCTN